MAQFLGYPHPDFMEEELTERQIAEWVEVLKRYPIGERRNDYRAAQICYNVVATQADKASRKKLKFADFILGEAKEQKTPTPEELRDKLKAWTERNYGNSNK